MMAIAIGGAQGRMRNYRWVGDFILLNACNFWIGARKNNIIKYRILLGIFVD